MKDVNILNSVLAAPSRTIAVEQNETSFANCLHYMRAAARVSKVESVFIKEFQISVQVLTLNLTTAILKSIVGYLLKASLKEKETA